MLQCYKYTKQSPRDRNPIVISLGISVTQALLLLLKTTNTNHRQFFVYVAGGTFSFIKKILSPSDSILVLIRASTQSRGKNVRTFINTWEHWPQGQKLFMAYNRVPHCQYCSVDLLTGSSLGSSLPETLIWVSGEIFPKGDVKGRTRPREVRY